ncbi:MAG: hypothetical protein DI539_17965 [Flavobacterium psychrophilum]|nr:MAG: hypothetical protein DI539_17965 [Flavobacterium psychrophilum]
MKKLATAFLSVFFAFTPNAQGSVKNIRTTEDERKAKLKAPEYPGGLKAFLNTIEPKTQRAISYRPGSMILTFMVNEDGSISEIETIEGISPKFDEKVREIIATSPKWIPGEEAGRPVKAYYKLPLHFN